MNLDTTGTGTGSFPVDITFEDSLEEHHSSVFYSIQSVSLIRNKTDTYSSLKPLVILVKKLLSAYRLNIPYRGT